MFSDEEVKQCETTNVGSDVVRDIMAKTAELLSARGGTAEDVATALSGVPDGPGGDAERAAVHRLAARVAALEENQLAEGGKRDLADALERIESLTARLHSAEESVRELTRRAQQAEETVERLRLTIKADRFAYKNLLEERRRLEARCDTLSAAGQVLSAHVDKVDAECCENDDRPYPQRHPHIFAKNADGTDECWEPSAHGSWCGWPAADHRCPCSPTCTHDDAAKPGHPERVRERSEAFVVANGVSEATERVVTTVRSPMRRKFKDAEEENVWADGWEEGLKTGEEKGAEAMRAACLEAVRQELVKFGITRDEPMYVGMKSAIEGAAP